MSVIKPRNKLLICRLTEDEYESLQAASSLNGARSLSEFTRAQLFGSLERPALGAQINELQAAVTRLARKLEQA